MSEHRGGAADLTLEISKTQLASILGTIPETLSRILARMTKEALIESEDKRHIRILDRTALEELPPAGAGSVKQPGMRPC